MTHLKILSLRPKKPFPCFLGCFLVAHTSRFLSTTTVLCEWSHRFTENMRGSPLLPSTTQTSLTEPLLSITAPQGLVSPRYRDHIEIIRCEEDNNVKYVSGTTRTTRCLWPRSVQLAAENSITAEWRPHGERNNAPACLLNPTWTRDYCWWKVISDSHSYH